MTVWHYTGSVSFIRSHIELLTPAAQDWGANDCWQVLITRKGHRTQSVIENIYFWTFAFVWGDIAHCSDISVFIFLHLGLHQNGRNTLFHNCFILCLPAQELNYADRCFFQILISLWAYQEPEKTIFLLAVSYFSTEEEREWFVKHRDCINIQSRCIKVGKRCIYKNHTHTANLWFQLGLPFLLKKFTEQRHYWLHVDFLRVSPMDLTWITCLFVTKGGGDLIKAGDPQVKSKREEEVKKKES